MKKVLVTGANGFIGSMLIEQLNGAAEGSGKRYEVYALLRKTSDVSNLRGLKYRRVEGDLSNLDSLKRAVRGMDIIFHLAGVVTAPRREVFFKYNSEGTRLLAEAAAEAAPGLSRFIHVSSLAASGPALSLDDPRREEEVEAPVSAYGESKLAGERELLKFKDRFPVTIVRPPMVYGPRDKAIFVMIRTVARRLMPLIQGATRDGSKYYSLIHVHDLCRGLIQAAETPREKSGSGEVFFLSEEGIHTYRELLMTMARHLNVKPLPLKLPRAAVVAAAGAMTGVGLVTRKTFPLNWDKLNEILPDYWICSNRKAKEMLGFSPQFDLSAGMADAIKWYKDQKWI